MGTGELNESKHINCGIFIYIYIKMCTCLHGHWGIKWIKAYKQTSSRGHGYSPVPIYIYINLINTHKTYDICILYLAKTSIWLLISARSFQWTIDSADPLTGAWDWQWTQWKTSLCERWRRWDELFRQKTPFFCWDITALMGYFKVGYNIYKLDIYIYLYPHNWNFQVWTSINKWPFSCQVSLGGSVWSPPMVTLGIYVVSTIVVSIRLYIPIVSHSYVHF